MKLEFSRQIFEEHSNTKFHKNSSIGSRVAPRGRTDRRRGRRDEANSHFLRNFTKAPKNSVRISQKILTFLIRKINWLMIYSEILVLYCEKHVEHLNISCGKV
jgi:hypothetical protein